MHHTVSNAVAAVLRALVICLFATLAIGFSSRAAQAQVPTVSGLAPNGGPQAGGTLVTIAGSAFTGATAVSFGATPATSFAVVSDSSITATAPAGTGLVNVTVTSPGGTSAITFHDQFTYNTPPTVTGVAPNSGPPAGGTIVTITGTLLSGATSVKFGAVNATSFTVMTESHITATAPAGAGTVDVTVTTPSGGTTATSAADQFTYTGPTTATTVTSSVNPSNLGQAVTFTATVSGSPGTPTGNVAFNDNGVAIGTATLTGGVATLTISTLKTGSHSITVAYGGGGGFGASTSAPLIQSVNIPVDSVKLHQLQDNLTPLVAQNSGAAISGAVDSAISEGFSDGGPFMSPSGTGFHFNFAADGDEQPQGSSVASGSPGGNSTAFANEASRPGDGRVDDAFAAIDQQMPTKAPKAKIREEKDWLLWADVRGTGFDRMTSTQTAAGLTTTPAPLTGFQVNALMGLTRKLSPNILVGVFGGYETFNYTEQDISGKLTGDGWTVGSYLGWRITPFVRYDLAAAYSGINYTGTAGTAQGLFTGERWLISTGFTGTYKAFGLLFEPSAKIYALWENEGAYTDSLGTLQPSHDFSVGRASVGDKVSYLYALNDRVSLVPYAGLYADYYFEDDNATSLVAPGQVPLASVPLLQGWSARFTAGLGARLASGAILTAGAEYGGIGSDYQLWTFKARANLPF